MSHDKETTKKQNAFECLWDEVTNLWRLCNDFEILYADSENREIIDGMDSSDFFESHRILLADGICAGICRLMDPEVTGRKENLSFAYFVSNSENEINNLYDQIKDLIKPFKTHRNKHISHNDRKIFLASLNGEVDFLPRITRAQLRKVLVKMSSLLDAINDAERYGKNGKHEELARNRDTAQELIGWITNHSSRS